MSSLTAVPARPISSALAEPPRQSLFSIRSMGTMIIVAASVILACGTAMECHSIFHLPSLLYGMVFWNWWAIIASTFWLTGLKYSFTLPRTFPGIALQLLIACAAGVVHLMLLGSLSLFVSEWKTNAPTMQVLIGAIHLNRFGFEMLIYGFIFGLIGIVQAQIRAQRDALKSSELQRQLSAAQLKALQMQLEPHFLFNTLNAITTLIELGRQSQAAEMLGHLNVILKRTLERSAPEKVPLSQELEIVENYLAIEQIRFSDRLRIDIRTDPAALHGLIPYFLLQPLVENAIRHGIAGREADGTVIASARRDGDRLRITVRDTGPGTSSVPSGNGIGLKNTRERLTYFYPERHSLEAGPIKSGGYEVTIDLPYETT